MWLSRLEPGEYLPVKTGSKTFKRITFFQLVDVPVFLFFFFFFFNRPFPDDVFGATAKMDPIYLQYFLNRVKKVKLGKLGYTCLQHVGDWRWWESLTMVPAGNETKCLLSVNHTTKTIHHHHLILLCVVND